jgi:hypothetical protein
MRFRATEWLRTRWTAFSQTRFGCLVGLFAVRVFGGGSDAGVGDLDVGVGVMVVLFAMPGALASLLMFAEYGSLIRFLRGQSIFDPFTATIPDEYFYIVLSLVVSGAAALWRWDAIFLDRRDYMNLAPLPLSLRSIFFANLCAILGLAGLLTIVVNGVSLILFPAAVVGSQGSLFLFLRFAAGHAAAVFLASTFSFLAVFAVIGLLMAVLPPALFRRVSLSIRFLGVIGLLTLLATSFAVPDWLKTLSTANARRAAALPPISFLGIARTVWGRGTDPFSIVMTRGAFAATGFVLLTAIIAYTLSFRRSFARIPETIDAAPMGQISNSFSPLGPFHRLTLRSASRRACYQFVAKTMMRSERHLQIILASIGVGLMASAEVLTSAPHHRAFWASNAPPVEFLSIPFALSYCLVVGVRLAFEMPLDLRANWIFKYWLDPSQDDARAAGRRALLAFCIPWVGGPVFIVTLVFWGWIIALLHSFIWMACTIVLVEVLMLRFRKIPFTCPHPSFQSRSPLILVAYISGFFVFTTYLPQLDRWSVLSPVQVLWLVSLLCAIAVALYAYRRQMLDMDKQLTFDDVSASGFW